MDILKTKCVIVEELKTTIAAFFYRRYVVWSLNTLLWEIFIMQYATNVTLVTCRTLNIFRCRVLLWKRLLNVLGVGLEYFLALALVPSPWPWPWPWPCFFCKSLALALALNTSPWKHHWSFHSLSLLIRSSLVSAITTRSSALQELPWYGNSEFSS